MTSSLYRGALPAIRCQTCSCLKNSAKPDDPCPLGCPPDPLPVCEDCGDPVPEGEGCRHDGRVWCGSCFVERCRECVDDLKDSLAHAAERDER